MISTEVGKGRDVKGDRLRATEHQCVRGSLHNNGLGSLLDQKSQQSLQVCRLWGRHSRGNAVQCHAVQSETDGADQFKTPAELDAYLVKLRDEMKAAAANLDFEKAAAIRDDIKRLRNPELLLPRAARRA